MYFIVQTTTPKRKKTADESVKTPKRRKSSDSDKGQKAGKNIKGEFKCLTFDFGFLYNEL